MTETNGSRARLELLAAQITEDLSAAGLPIAGELQSLRTLSGVSLEVDPDDGVYVSWLCHYVVSVVVREETARFHQGPAWTFDGEVTRAMREAIATILRASGYVFDKDFRGPYTGDALLVTGHETVPSWRDWHEKQHDRRGRIQARLIEAHRNQAQAD